MNIDLPDDLEAYIRAKLATGQYTSPAEVISEALRVLRGVEQSLPEAEDDLRREIDVGLRDVEEGRTSDWSLERMKDLVRRNVQGKKAS